MHPVVYILTAALVSGCAFSSVTRPDAKSNSAVKQANFQIAEPIAAKAAEAALKSMGYEVDVASNETGMVRSKPKSVPTPDFCDCGTWNASTITGTADSILIAKTDVIQGGTSISLEHSCRTNFTGRNLFYVPTRRENYECVSKGNVEQEFWTATRRALSRASSASVN